MHRRTTMALFMLAASGLLLAGVALAQVLPADQTQPAGDPTPPERPQILDDMYRLTNEIHAASLWAAIFSCLALVGVLWVGWSQRAICRNQVELAEMIQQLGSRPD